MITARDRFFMRLKPEDVLKAIDIGKDVTFAVDYDLELNGVIGFVFRNEWTKHIVK